METNENIVVASTYACEKFLGDPDLTMDKLKAAYRERDYTCAEIGEEFEELEQETASLRAEIASLKDRYKLYDYYMNQTIAYEQQIAALKKALSGLTSYIEVKA